MLLKILDPPPLIQQVKDKWGKCFSAQDSKNLSLLLSETWGRPYRFEPYVDHMERLFHGTNVNVSQQGFRYIENQGPWPPVNNVINIFIFGGSTTFGYGVSDGHTIPSFLQNILRDRLKKEVNVYNFGGGHFYSSQELILFERLISKLDVPIHMAIFIDGLNDFGNPQDQSPASTELKQVLDGRLKYSAKLLISNIPLVQLFSYFSHPAKLLATVDESKTAQKILKRYQKNKQIIEGVASISNTKTLFVWQPVPWYPKYSEIIQSLMGDFKYTKLGYEMTYQAYLDGKFGLNFLWLADETTQSQCANYVDSIHYSPRMAQQLAQRIANQIEPLLSDQSVK